MAETTLNRKAFKDEFKTSIEQGLINAYKELYPNNDIKIKYESKQNEWYFEVFVTSFPILDNDKVKKKTVFLTSYDNEKAVNFSSISRDDYNKEYNDYSFDNHIWLKEQIESLAVLYKLHNIDFEDINVSNNGYSVHIYPSNHPRNVFNGSEKWISGGFGVIPISMTTAKNILAKVKRAANEVLKE